MKNYPRIRDVRPLAGKKLRVTFGNGAVRVYDCRPLLKERPFKALQDDALFRMARADEHGYAVIWNDEIDLAESEIWLHGRVARGAVTTFSLRAPQLATPNRRARTRAGAAGSARKAGT